MPVTKEFESIKAHGGINFMERTKRVHYSWWILAAGFILYFTVQALTMQVMGLFTKPISEEFDVPRSVFLLHNVALNLGGLIAAPIWGKLLKKYNMQRLMAFGIVMTGVGFYLTTIAPNIYMLIAAGFFRGVFFIGTTMLPLAMLLTSWFEEKRGFAMSIMTASAGIGGVVFNPLVQQIITEYGWRKAELFIAAVVLATTPIVLLIIRAEPAQKGLKPYGYKEENEQQEQKKAAKPATGYTLKEAAKTPYFYILLFASFATTFVAGAMMQLSPYLTDLGYEPMFAAQTVSLLALISIFGRPLMGVIHDKFKSTTAACIFFTSAAVGFLFLSNASNLLFLRVAVVLWAFNSGISLIMPPLWTAELFGTKEFAAIVSMTVAMNRFGSMSGGYIIGLLYDITGNNDLIWPICSALMVISMGGIVFSLKKMRKQKKEVMAMAMV